MASERVVIIREEIFERDVLHNLSDIPERYCSNYERKIQLTTEDNIVIKLERCMRCYKCYQCFKRMNQVQLMNVQH